MKKKEALADIALQLADIAGQLGRINNSIGMLEALEMEIVEDLRNRRMAERASYLAYHRMYAEAEEHTAAKNVLPEETPA